MNVPLSNSIGNALEVEEAIKVLKGQDCRLFEVSKEISSILISKAKKIPINEAEDMVDEVINNKMAYKKFLEFVSAQGGDIKKLKVDAKVKIIRSELNGILTNINAEKIGLLSLKLGAGKINDLTKIDYSAGIKLYKKRHAFKPYKVKWKYVDEK